MSVSGVDFRFGGVHLAAGPRRSKSSPVTIDSAFGPSRKLGILPISVPGHTHFSTIIRMSSPGTMTDRMIHFHFVHFDPIHPVDTKDTMSAGENAMTLFPFQNTSHSYLIRPDKR